MIIQFSLPYVFQTIRSTFHIIHNTIKQKIETIKNRVWHAYHASAKDVPKLVLRAHPVPNPYPKEYKRTPWPKFLDNAWGASFANPKDVKNIAHLKEPREKVTPLHAVTLGNNKPGLLRLIADNGDVEALDIRGQTPAYWAAYKGNLEMLMKLKTFGANLSHKDYRGKTPIRAAAKYGHEKIIDFLASHKVNLNEKDGRGLTPLHIAAYHKHFSTYQALIYYGADRTIKDRDGRTAEDILKMKYAEDYHHRCFIIRLFSSPNPPLLSLKPYKVKMLTTKVHNKI